MDAIALLKKDHKTVRDLPGQLSHTDEPAESRREVLLAKIAKELQE